jgi:hypothetical protein
MALVSTQPLTEMSTRNISWGVKAAGAYGWQPTTFMCRLSRNLGASTSWNPAGLSRPIMGLLYLFLLVLNTVLYFSIPTTSTSSYSLIRPPTLEATCYYKMIQHRKINIWSHISLCLHRLFVILRRREYSKRKAIPVSTVCSVDCLATILIDSVMFCHFMRQLSNRAEAYSNILFFVCIITNHE